MRKLLASISVGVLLLTGLSIQPAGAATFALEGSDATTFHDESTYTAQLFSFMKDGSALPVFVLGGPGGLSGAPAGTVIGAVLPGTLTTVYSGIYIESPGGCCSEQILSAADQAAVAAFYAGGTGGSVAIQNYQGGNSGITGFTPGVLDIGGLGGGAGGPTCFDSEVFNATGISKGFSQPGILGCWGHQAFNTDFFGPLGFISLVDSGLEFASIGTGHWSSFLALGGALGTPLPEPATLLLLGAGLFGIAAARRARV